MKIAIGSDRKGFENKNLLVQYLIKKNYSVKDCGTYENIPCDAPVYAEKVSKLVADGICDFGILICDSGEAMVIASNKVKGVMCGLAYNDDVAYTMRQHNDCNIIAFGAAYMSIEDIEHRTDIFLTTDFLGDYHKYRVDQVKVIEQGGIPKPTPVLNKQWNTENT